MRLGGRRLVSSIESPALSGCGSLETFRVGPMRTEPGTIDRFIEPISGLLFSSRFGTSRDLHSGSPHEPQSGQLGSS